ncbi:MAG: ACT domain-containing protein [Syntrophobacteria bacterium]
MSPDEILQIFPVKTKRGLVQISLLGIPNRPGTSRPLFDLLERHGVPIKFLLEGISNDATRDLVICVTGDAMLRLQPEMDDIRARMQPRAVIIRESVAVIRVLGPHFDIRPGPSGLLFTALARAGIQIYSNATTITSSTCVIPDDHVEAALRAIGRTFEIPRGKR